MGSVESAIGMWRTKLKVLRFCFETRYGVTVGPNHKIWPHLCGLAGFLGSRFRLRANGQSAYFASHGCEYKGEIAMIGEALMIKIPVSKTRQAKGTRTVHKADAAWLKGLWMGKDLLTDDHIVMTAQGLVKGRGIRRLPADRRVDKELLRDAFGDPWASPEQRLQAETFRY